MTALRVGIFVMKFPQLSETFIVTKVLKLLDAGFDVHIFATSRSEHWDAFDILRDRHDVRARVHVLPRLAFELASLARGTLVGILTAAHAPIRMAKLIGSTWLQSDESRLRALYLRTPFVRWPVDILHIEFDAQGLGIVSLKRFLQCRILLSSRGTFQQLTVLDQVPDAPQRLFAYADGYHFISQFLEDNTRALGLPDTVPRWLIEPAIDLRLFTPRARVARTRLRIISVGRLSWEKGYEFALEALAHVKASGVDFEYLIYGSGPYEEPIRYAVEQLGLDDHVTLRGSIKREEMPAAYAEADLMIHAALAEGFCNAVIEAQAMELPVVVTDAGGLPENVADGITGFVVKRRDARAMAARIVELAADELTRTRLGRAGRVRALERFDLDRQAERFVALYNELAQLPIRPIP